MSDWVYQDAACKLLGVAYTNLHPKKFIERFGLEHVMEVGGSNGLSNWLYSADECRRRGVERIDQQLQATKEFVADYTRLRRLDALFAERVLGLELPGTAPPPSTREIREATGGAVSHQTAAVYLRGEKVSPESRLIIDIALYNAALLPYTRSLDAAWEVAKLERFCCINFHADYSYQANVYTDASHLTEEHAGSGRSESHPAEALVLACLRAVGCSEEELV